MSCLHILGKKKIYMYSYWYLLQANISNSHGKFVFLFQQKRKYNLDIQNLWLTKLYKFNNIYNINTKLNIIII